MQLSSPDSRGRAAADLSHCRALLAGGSKTFYAASFLLPQRVRDPATALYAFCRIADDLIDQAQSTPQALASLEHRLDRAYLGNPGDDPADRAFAEAVHRFRIPKAMPAALIEGFAWDHEGRRYRTISDLRSYGARVAGSVGAMMAIVMGCGDDSQLARACDLGVAMQLTNIARDVGEDARAGRLYLPEDWMREAGLDPDAWLARPHFCSALGSVVARLLEEAARLYERSEAGIVRLPVDCRPGIFAARYLYAGIGTEVSRMGMNSVDRRAVVSAARKLSLLSRASAAAAISVAGGPIDRSDILDEVRFLVEAARATGALKIAHAAVDPFIPWWDLPQRTARVIDLFDRLERLERLGHLSERGPRSRGSRRETAARAI